MHGYGGLAWSRGFRRTLSGFWCYVGARTIEMYNDTILILELDMRIRSLTVTRLVRS